MSNYLFDIDGTVSQDISNETPELMPGAEAYEDMIEMVNKLYDEGHIITFFTARTDDHKEVTETWLKEKGFKYHNLILNKPRSNGMKYIYIDNMPGEYRQVKTRR